MHWSVPGVGGSGLAVDVPTLPGAGDPERLHLDPTEGEPVTTRRKFTVRFDLQPAPEGGVRLAGIHLRPDEARGLADDIHDILDTQTSETESQ